MHATTFARLDDEGELLEDAYLEVESSLDVLRASLHGADAASSPAEVDGHLATCEDNYQHCQRSLREFEVELDGASSNSRIRARAGFEKQKHALQKMRSSLDFRQSQRRRELLLEQQSLPLSRQGSDAMTPHQIIDQASAIQDQSKESVSRTLKLVQEARSIGASTVGQLHDQRSRLEAVDAQATAMARNLAQANKEAAAYAAGILDDSSQQVLLALIAVGLVFIVVMKLTEVGDDPPVAEHHLQTTLITPFDEGPWD